MNTSRSVAENRERRDKASRQRLLAISALRRGEILRVSDRTDVEQGLVHFGAAKNLVRRRLAEYVPGVRILHIRGREEE